MADGIVMRFVGFTEAREALDGLEAKVAAASAQFVVDAGHALQALAMAKAVAGRPGPIRRTGTLARSIQFVGPTPMGDGLLGGQVGSALIYSRRLELGFKGADSLGRNYDQPPYPWLQPAWTEGQKVIQALWERACLKAVT